MSQNRREVIREIFRCHVLEFLKKGKDLGRTRGLENFLNDNSKKGRSHGLSPRLLCRWYAIALAWEGWQSTRQQPLRGKNMNRLTFVVELVHMERTKLGAAIYIHRQPRIMWPTFKGKISHEMWSEYAPKSNGHVATLGDRLIHLIDPMNAIKKQMWFTLQLQIGNQWLSKPRYRSICQYQLPTWTRISMGIVGISRYGQIKKF